jgi:cytochrome b6-f complex iron-sulfur subunit
VLVGAVLFGCRSEPSPDVDIGARSKVLARLAQGAPLEFGKGRRPFYVVAFPKTGIDNAVASYPAEIGPALSLGVLALSQRSPHLGLRVIWCPTSAWFEDPAHGEKFSSVGEYTEGPAPRSMDLYPVRLTDDDHLVVNTRRRVPGVPVGTHTVDSTLRGPRCVGR